MKFKEFIILQRGYDLPKSKMKTGPYPVVGSTSVIGNHSQFKALPPGVATGRSGSLGTIQYINEPYWPHNTSLWVKDFKGNYPRFVFYFLQTLKLEQYNAGVGVPTLNRNHLDLLDVSIPPLPTQRKIAAILSAYDDLIENNTRRIKILEEMAQNLYREWFVKFRFPGHEHARFVDSPLGRIPEGWEVKTVGEIVLNFDRLRKPLSSMQRASREGMYPYYGAAKIFDYIDDYIFDGVYLLLAEDGSVMTQDKKPVLQYVSGKFWANNHTHILQGKSPISTEFLYLAFSDVNISGYITGAAQPKINQMNLNRIPIIVPNMDYLRNFNYYVLNLFQMKIILDKENQTLRTTRDLLLPKLISGEVDVSYLNITIPEAAMT